jgi:putative addiction module component (TIGR02574 family)
MDLDLEQLTAAVLRLPDSARADLATRLLASLEPDAPGESAAAIASAWDAELDRREAELAEDPSLGIPAAEVFRLLEADLAAQRAALGETVR